MLEFLAPRYLWLLLLLPLVWGLAFAVPRTYPRWRFWLSLALRTAGTGALVLALAAPQIIRPTDTHHVVFLLDSSDSISLSQRAHAERYIQQALASMPDDDRAGIVVFGTQALVERMPDDAQTLGQITSFPPGSATNIQEAVQLGLALLPAETQRRLVLLSDGGENSGDAQSAAQIAAAQGVPIDVVPLTSAADGFDAIVSGIDMPSAVGVGQNIRLVVHLDSTGLPTTDPVPARLVVEQRRPDPADPLQPVQTVPLIDEEVLLTGEPQTFAMTLPPPPDRFNRYVVQILVPDDMRQQNNAVEAFTFVWGMPHILLVEGDARAARPLAQALDAVRIETSVVPPSDVPSRLSELAAYDAVVLLDVPERAMAERTIAALEAYVRDMGHGLAMVGGPNSFGTGGWRDTPVERVLPVTMDIRTPQFRQPPVSIVVIIDVSGSMATAEGAYSKIELAAEGAARIATRLRDEDEITVIPFDTEPRGTVGPLPGTQRTLARERIAGIEAGGGGIDAQPALKEAARFVRASDKPIRHIIMISDGNDTVTHEGARELVQELNAEGVTVSTVSIGRGKDTGFLNDVTIWGKGRFFLTEQAREIPDILTSEVEIVVQPLIREGTFLPVRLGDHSILRNVDTLPVLHGYVATTPRASAQVLLQTEDGEPLLAVWNYGLGRSLAWTPDMRGRWASEWVLWDDFPQVADRMIGWLVPSADTQNIAIESYMAGDRLELAAIAQTESGIPVDGLDIAGHLIASDGTTTTVQLHEVMPGRYQVARAGLTPGAYLVQLQATDASGQLYGSVTGGVAVPFSGEYRSQNHNPALLNTLASVTSGRQNPPPDAVYDDTQQRTGTVYELALPLVWFALLVWPFDIALRRLVRGSRQPARASRPAAGTPPAGESRPEQPPLPQPYQPPTPARSDAQNEDPIEQLRARQEEARRRARGEE